MASKSKTKGKTAERELCKIFQSVFGGSWIRVPNSGAFTGGKNFSRAATLSQSQLLNSSNDIVPPDEFPNVSIESKFYQEIEFHHFYRAEGCNLLNGWVKQVWESGIDMSVVFPMICFKINRKGWYITLWKDKLKDYDLTKIPHTTYTNDYIICDLMLFLNTFKKEMIKSMS